MLRGWGRDHFMWRGRRADADGDLGLGGDTCSEEESTGGDQKRFFHIRSP
jgi:hypothetical protein